MLLRPAPRRGRGLGDLSVSYHSTELSASTSLDTLPVNLITRSCCLDPSLRVNTGFTAMFATSASTTNFIEAALACSKRSMYSASAAAGSQTCHTGLTEVSRSTVTEPNGFSNIWCVPSLLGSGEIQFTWNLLIGIALFCGTWRCPQNLRKIIYIYKIYKYNEC